MCSTNIYTNNNATRAFTQVGKRVGVGGVAGVNQPPYIYIHSDSREICIREKCQPQIFA